MTFSWGLHNVYWRLDNVYITFSWRLHYVYMTFTRRLHNVFMTFTWRLHDVCITCICCLHKFKSTLKWIIFFLEVLLTWTNFTIFSKLMSWSEDWNETYAIHFFSQFPPFITKIFRFLSLAVLMRLGIMSFYFKVLTQLPPKRRQRITFDLADSDSKKVL